MRGIPPHELFECPSRESGHQNSPRDGGYMRRAMAVPERQPALHERLKEINYADFSNQTGTGFGEALRQTRFRLALEADSGAALRAASGVSQGVSQEVSQEPQSVSF